MACFGCSRWLGNVVNRVETSVDDVAVFMNILLFEPMVLSVD